MKTTDIWAKLAQAEEKEKARNAQTTPLMQQLSEANANGVSNPLTRYLVAPASTIQTKPSTQAVDTPETRMKDMGAVIDTSPSAVLNTFSQAAHGTLPTAPVERYTDLEKGFNVMGNLLAPKNANTFLGGLQYPAARAAQGFVGAVEAPIDFVVGGLNKLGETVTSLGGTHPNAVSNFFGNNANYVYNNNVAKAMGEGISEKSGDVNKLTSLSGDIYQAAVPMLAGIKGGQAISGATGVAADNASKMLIGLQAAGAGAQQAHDEGANVSQAQLYGALSGALEVAVEGLGGSMNGLGKGYLSTLVSKINNVPGAAKVITDIVGEGGEEVLSDYISPYLQRAIYNPDAADATLGQLAQSFVTGAAMSAIMQAAQGVGNIGRARTAQNVVVNSAQTPLDIGSQPAQAPTIEQNDLTSKLPIQNQNATQGVVEPVVDDKPMEMPREQTGPHIDERVYSDVSSRKVNAFQFDNPELHEHYAVAANGLQNDLRMATKGERFGVKDSDGYYVDSIGIKRSVSPEIEALLDNAKLSYAQIEKGLADLIADHGQENYAAAKKIELVLDNMLTNGYEVEGYQIEPDYEYIQKKEAIKSGEHSNEYAMTEDEWNALLKSEPATSPAQPAIFPENSLGAKIAQQLPEGTGAASYGFDPYTNLQNQFGNIPVGENPTRVVDVPLQTAENNMVSRGVRTAMEAQATPDTALGDIQDAVVDGKFSYIPITDTDAKTRAEQTIQHKGWENAVRDWTADARRGVVSKDHIVLGQTLYNNAINSGNTKEGVDILVDLVKMSRSGAQATQANRVLKQLSPEYQLYALQRSVQSLSDELTQKFAKGGFDGITLNEALVAEYMAAQTEEARNAAMEKIKDDVASQVPASWMDKWNAWRYLSMLGNPRTHVRNIVGNAGFTPVRMIKNVIATGIEKASGKGQTKSVLTLKDKPLIQYALSDYDGVSEQIMSLGKLDNFTGDINSRRRIFKSKAIEGARKFNAKALDVEDVWFAKPAYANALAGWYKANGVTSYALKNGMVSQEKIDSGRAYAIREAQRATYRDANQFSDWVSKLGSGYTGDNKIAKTANVLVEGVLPFKRTPANILARAFEYSPAGLIRGLTSDLVQVKNGNMEAWQAIDNISAGLTGTGLVGLGAWLAASGALSGASGDDDEKALNNLTGAQNWSLNIGGKSITLDWLAPEALPLFVGVELWNAAMDKGEDGLSIMTFLDKLSNITEPMFEMSMLQGVNDLLDSIKYSENNNLVGIATTAAVNYLSQGLPTLLGQIERSFEPDRKSTYTNSEKDLPTSTQRMLGKISGKIPFWEYQQTEYRDAFGRTESNGTAAERIINNFLNPAYAKDLTNDKVTNELRRLNDDNYLESVPDAPAKSFNYGGEKHVLSADEYSKFQKTAGEKTYSLLDGLIGSSEYKKLNDEKKAKLVEQIVSYSTDTAKREHIGEDYKSGNYEKVYEAEQAGIEPTKYFMYKDALEDIRPEGGTPAQYQYSKAIDTLDLSTQYKSKLWEIQNGGESDKNPFTGILAQKGMAPEDCIKIMEEYNKLDKSMDGYTKAEDGPGKSQVQAAYFIQWLESAGYTKAQTDYIADVFKTWQMIPIEKPSKKALAYVETNPR